MIYKYLCTLALFASISSFAQCPTASLMFDSQDQINAFAIDFPDCSFVSGSVTISGGDISDLGGLSGITSIGGELNIELNPSLTSLAAWEEVALLGEAARITIIDNALLEELTSFFGVLNEGLTLGNLPMLSDISGLNGISSASRVTFVNCDALTNVQGLENIAIGNELVITGNDLLTDLSNFNFNIGPLEVFEVSSNLLLNSLEGLEGLEMSESGFFNISANTNLLDLVGLSGISTAPFGITINGNESLLSLSGLSNMSGSTDVLSILNNDLLASPFGLDGLNQVRRIELRDNNNLISLLGLQGIENLSLESPFLLFILDHLNLNDISAINDFNTSNVGVVTLLDNTNLDFCNYDFICSIIQDKTVEFTAKGNKGNCESVGAIEESCGLSVVDMLLLERVQLFPNPVSTSLQVDLPVQIILNEIVVFDVLGNKLMSTTNTNFELTCLANGMYFVRIKTQSGAVTKRVIKQ